MIGKVVKPIGIVLAGILCIYLDGFAAEKDAKKSSEPAKKAAKAASKKEAAVPKKEEAAPAKQEDDSKKVVATVNGENISQQDVNQMLSRFGKQIPEEQIPTVTKQIVDGLITQKLIMQFIKKKKKKKTKKRNKKK